MFLDRSRREVDRPLNGSPIRKLKTRREPAAAIRHFVSTVGKRHKAGAALFDLVHLNRPFKPVFLGQLLAKNSPIREPTNDDEKALEQTDSADRRFV